MDQSVSVRVLTLNCWGIVYVSKDRRPRMQAIAKHFATSIYDFVCLQEVWSVNDFLFISKECKSCLPYSHYFNSGVNGSGLCVLSKYPIQDVYFHQWPINGYAHKVHQGDWFGGKGVGLCRINMNGRIVNLYTTHLHAEYDAINQEYLNHRILQSFDTSQFIKFTSRDCDLVILAGDLNSEPDDPAIPLLLLNAQLQDCFYVAQKRTIDCEGTNESSRISYTPEGELKRKPEGKRIDYIMYKSASELQVNVIEYLFPLPNRVPGCSFSYSDHDAVEVIMECFPRKIKPGCGDSEDQIDTSDQLSAALSSAIEICEDSLRRLRISKIKYWSVSAVLGALLILTLFLELLVSITDPVAVVFYNLLQVVLTTGLIFTVLMALVWNQLEVSAVLNGKYSMKLIFKQLNQGPTS